MVLGRGFSWPVVFWDPIVLECTKIVFWDECYSRGYVSTLGNVFMIFILVVN